MAGDLRASGPSWPNTIFGIVSVAAPGRRCQRRPQWVCGVSWPRPPLSLGLPTGLHYKAQLCLHVTHLPPPFLSLVGADSFTDLVAAPNGRDGSRGSVRIRWQAVR
jgi:hypothetical protein